MILLRDRLLLAITTLPDWPHCFVIGAMGVLLALLLIPLGMALGFLKWDVIRNPKTIVAVMAIALLTPGITEELVFRVLLLPHPHEVVSLPVRAGWAMVSLILFIVYHPLNALSFYPAGRQTFLRFDFLLLAALLGIICTIAYFQTGSLWLPAFLHWLMVVVWLLFLGGYNRLHQAIR